MTSGARGLVMLVAGVLLVGVMTTRKKDAPTVPARRGAINRDWNHLLPSFRDRLRAVFEALKRRGFDPYLHEGLRSKERTAELAKRGVGSPTSLHQYGAAADVISAARHWDWPEFFEALGEEVQRAGLVWGPSVRPGDTNHVQAIAGSQEAKFRRLPEADRDRYVANRLENHSIT